MRSLRFGFNIAIEGRLRDYMEARDAVAAKGMTKAAGLAGRQVQGRWRKAVEGAGLGKRLSNSIRANVYPGAGQTSLRPAAFVYTNAPKLLRVYATGAKITPRNGGLFLAIPTENVPRRGRGHVPMTTEEVERSFDGLQFIPSRRQPGVYLAVVNAVQANNKRGFRKATGRRQQGSRRYAARKVIQVVMFIMIKQVRLMKRYDFDKLEREAQQLWPDIAARSLRDALRNEKD